MAAVLEQLAPDAVVTPQEAIQLGASSLIAYGQLFFPRTFRQSSPQFHEEIGRQLYSSARYNAFEVFRDGAKTSLLRVYTSQRIAYGISRTIMYVSSSQTHSSFSLRWIKRQIEFNKPWAQLFGLRKGSKWTDEIIEIYHGVEDTPITVLAVGITGQIRGFNLDDYRPDLIIADDVQTDENVATLEQRQKLKDTFFGALVNSLAPATDAPSAKIVLLNTPMVKDDLIETCMADPSWHGQRFGIFDEHGNSRWEARWPTSVMKQEKENATKAGRYSIWMREKECMIVKKESKQFDIANLRYWDVLPDGMTVLGSIDPASSEAKTADDNVVMSVGFKGADIYVLEYSAEQGEMPDATAMHFFNQVIKWRPAKFGSEAIGFQRVLAWYLEQEMRKRRLFIQVERIQDRRNKQDRIIQAISGNLAYRNIWIKPGMEKLISQLDEFGEGGHDDVIDALAMAISMANPALRDDSMTIEGEFRTIQEEEELLYPSLNYERGAP
ncbi:MAG: hypothetical protein ACKOX6_00850 [Bdellovibrio sp.]